MTSKFFEVGDNVVCREAHTKDTLWVIGMERIIGRTLTVELVDNQPPGNIRVSGYYLRPEWVELAQDNNLKENEMTTQKFYRLKKDLHSLVAGAILSENSNNNYEPISDVWNTHEESDAPSVVFNQYGIEHSPDWFERVYEVQVNGQTKYLLQDAARAAVETNLSATPDTTVAA